MPIKGLEKFTTLDYPGRDVAVVFYGGCNFRCPNCQNPDLVKGKLPDISEQEVLGFLERRREGGWLDGIVISGGEPTINININHGLKNFLIKVKDWGYEIKLDTNGSNYRSLQELKEEGLVDYAAMDVKAPPYLYSQTVGREVLRYDIEKGMKVTTQFPDYEFRTTVVPVIREVGIEFLTAYEVGDIARWIVETTGGDEHKYFLQKFISRKNGLLDERLEEFPETPEELMLKAKEEASRYLSRCEIR